MAIHDISLIKQADIKYLQIHKCHRNRAYSDQDDTTLQLNNQNFQQSDFFKQVGVFKLTHKSGKPQVSNGFPAQIMIANAIIITPIEVTSNVRYEV